MDNNNYQKLGGRTLVFNVFAGAKIAAILLLITLILVAIGMTAGFSETLNTVTFWAAIITVFALTITVLVAWLQYVFFRYSLGEDIIKIHRGVLTKEEIAIPYRRIESVDIRRTLIHQLFGVSRINIETTIDSELFADKKSDSSDEVFPAIDQHLARVIQEELTKRANIQKMRM